MRRLMFVILVSSLLVVLAFVQKGNVPDVKASSSIYQGDLILTGNNVTTIEGRFDINGSIIVEKNATLVLRNAILNFTQATSMQFNITLRNPANGNPRFLAYHSIITSALETHIYIKGNSTATINNSTISHFVHAYESSMLTVSNSSYVPQPRGYDSASIIVRNSTMGEWHNYGSPQVQVYDSIIASLLIGSTSVNCTISELGPRSFGYWSFITNCSLSLLSGGFTPNVTLTKTTVYEWRFAFYLSSNAIIRNSTISEAFASDLSVVYLKSTTCSHAINQASMSITDSSINLLTVGSPNTWLINSTYASLYVQPYGRFHVSWYLDAHVVDSIGQNAPFANVTAFYTNATLAESRLTDANGWARLTLMEKMMNATGEYPIGNYTVTAKYEVHMGEQSVNMTGNQEITLNLPFIIPEFPSFLILPLFMIATLLAVTVYRRKRIAIK